MIKTYGFTHNAFPVKDVKRSIEFYKKIFGTREMFTDTRFIQVQTPGSKDIIVFVKSGAPQPDSNPGLHSEFRLPKPVSTVSMIKTIKLAGGKIKETGRFVSGESYVFLHDPDGYEIEIWFEKIPAPLTSFN